MQRGAWARWDTFGLLGLGELSNDDSRDWYLAYRFHTQAISGQPRSLARTLGWHTFVLIATLANLALLSPEQQVREEEEQEGLLSTVASDLLELAFLQELAARLKDLDLNTYTRASNDEKWSVQLERLPDSTYINASDRALNLSKLLLVLKRRSLGVDVLRDLVQFDERLLDQLLVRIGILGGLVELAEQQWISIDEVDRSGQFVACTRESGSDRCVLAHALNGLDQVIRELQSILCHTTSLAFLPHRIEWSAFISSSRASILDSNTTTNLEKRRNERLPRCLRKYGNGVWMIAAVLIIATEAIGLSQRATSYHYHRHLHRECERESSRIVNAH